MRFILLPICACSTSPHSSSLALSWAFALVEAQCRNEHVIVASNINVRIDIDFPPGSWQCQSRPILRAARIVRLASLRVFLRLQGPDAVTPVACVALKHDNTLGFDRGA